VCVHADEDIDELTRALDSLSRMGLGGPSASASASDSKGGAAGAADTEFGGSEEASDDGFEEEEVRVEGVCWHVSPVRLTACQ